MRKRQQLSASDDDSLLVPYVIAQLYCISHALVIYAYVVTLHVAINSQTHMLTTLLLSNQFIELKTCVHKRYDLKRVLFMLCHDMIERFQLLMALFIVCAKNLEELRFSLLTYRFFTTLCSALL